ncbi:hypothetical protein LAZ67_14001831 [Cordylochernes scorpioides]|uniref:Reverse transcriptase domain-containing protein n=1 Tax=Cordylochernes scorpioides TaxID=51811 RepID=A0ABY6L6D7_9ARAC|nr:hypothetical protein LAZ67_14001831 [Cordylochernes scorpioides]
MASRLLKFSASLKELRLHLCQKSPESKGIREFIENHYVALKKNNPNFPILIRECSGVNPVVYARYEKGMETRVPLANMNQEQILDAIEKLSKINEELEPGVSVEEEIVSLGKSMGLEVEERDVNELIEEHTQELTTEEIQELQSQQHTEVMQVIGFEESEEEVISTSEIKEILGMWERVSQFNPLSGFEAAISKLNHQETNIIRHHVTNLLSESITLPPSNPHENRLIKDLRNKKEIIITQSDKGGQTVILNKTDYHSKMLIILEDQTTFKHISKEEKTLTYSSFKKELRKMHKERNISNEELKDFLSNMQTDAFIYDLPKIHKPNVPLRPIVAFYHSPTAPLSKFISTFLKPIIKQQNSPFFISNTTTFIDELLKYQPQPNKIMISFDVESLYPSLPHQLILSSTEEFLRENKVDQIVVRKITKLIALCLETNILTYDSKTDEQIKGSPMGSSLSTSVAEIVMRRIDNWITSLFPSDIVLWHRYIDDIFCICPENQTRNILERLNSYHPNLNFTFEKETNNSLPFLDIKIIRIQNQFQTTVYYKPSFNPDYIRFFSYCPLSHKINTVKTLTKRIHSHCSLQTFKTEETQNIIRNLKTCQYPLSFILRHFYSPSEIQNSPIYKSISNIPYSPIRKNGNQESGKGCSGNTPSLARAESPSKAEEKPARLGSKAQPSAELPARNALKFNSSMKSTKNQRYANPATGGKDANPAAPTDFAAASSSEAAAQAHRNWAELTEDSNSEYEGNFTIVQKRKRRRGSANSSPAAAPSSNLGGTRTNRRPQSSAGWAPRAQEVRTTRAHIVEARARQASSTEDHCVYVERSPELEPYHYMRAMDRMFGSTREVFQVTKMNGHFLVGLANRGMAERLVNEGLEVEGTLHRVFPFRKRAERITVGNLPFFVGDAAVISALTPLGRVTSIAPKLMKAGPYTYNDGRREAFIILREGMTIEGLPTRLNITIKGEAWPAYLSSGIRCSRCRGQGHHRANCPLLAGRTNAPGPATPTSPTSVPSASAPGLPQQPSAQPPPPASPSPAMEVSEVPSTSRAALPPAAPRQSPPVAPAIPTEMAPPAPPPVAPAPSLRAPGSHGPAVPTLDVEMSIEETSTFRAALKTSPAAVPPTPPLPAPQPAGLIPPAPDEEEMTPIMREECMVIEILKKLKHLTCLRPLYQSGIQPNDLKDAILFIDERESLMARLTPAMRGVLAEFLSAAIEPARGNHPDVSSDLASLRRRCLDS